MFQPQVYLTIHFGIVKNKLTTRAEYANHRFRGEQRACKDRISSNEGDDCIRPNLPVSYPARLMKLEKEKKEKKE